MLWCCIKMRSGACPVVTKCARGERENSPFCPNISSVALGAAGVGEGPAPRRDEPPLVALRMEGELQDAVGVVVVDLAVGDGLKDGVVALPSSANHKLPDPTLGVRFPVGVLLREALAVVLMAGEHHIYARCVENVPQGLHFLNAAMFLPRAEARMVEVGQGTALVVVGSEVRL